MSIYFLIFSLVIDSFASSIAYGSENITIKTSRIVLINFFSTLILGISIFFGSFLEDFLPNGLPSKISFCIFFSLGIYKLFEILIKKYFKKYSLHKQPLKFKLFDINFALNVYLDEKCADFDNSKYLSLKESFYLALALSLDSLAIGFGIGLYDINFFSLLFFSFIFGVISFKFGGFLGRKLKTKKNINLSWLSGLILILIAFTKL
ncbi:manganese efflux pump [Clostridium sp.]|uniref:manganese efflux pump n=1 Tax=Clostridium sp. TaxID=1506 RepID=UPI003F66DC44